jgi:hypothetical protein
MNRYWQSRCGWALPVRRVMLVFRGGSRAVRQPLQGAWCNPRPNRLVGVRKLLRVYSALPSGLPPVLSSTSARRAASGLGSFFNEGERYAHPVCAISQGIIGSAGEFCSSGSSLLFLLNLMPSMHRPWPGSGFAHTTTAAHDVMESLPGLSRSMESKSCVFRK